MMDINELKIKFNNAFEYLKEIGEYKTISNIIFNFEKSSCEFDNLSSETVDVDIFEDNVHSALDELNKWKENIILPQNIEVKIEKTEEDIGNNTISILQKLSNRDSNCRTSEISFNYSINNLDNSLGVRVLSNNINYPKTSFPMSKEMTKELILKEIVETFYDYVHGIKIETWK